MLCGVANIFFFYFKILARRFLSEAQTVCGNPVTEPRGRGGTAGGRPLKGMSPLSRPAVATWLCGCAFPGVQLCAGKLKIWIFMLK